MGCPEKRSTTVPDKVTVGTAGAIGGVGAVGAAGMLGRAESHALEDTVSKQPMTTGVNLERDFTMRIRTPLGALLRAVPGRAGALEPPALIVSETRSVAKLH